MQEVISLDNLYLIGEKNILTVVKMAEKGLAMKLLDTDEIKSVKKEDILRFELYRSTRNYAMRVITKNNMFELNNILEEMIEEIKKAVSDWYSLAVYVKPLEVSDTTKGSVSFSNECIEFRTEKLIFDLHLKDIVSVCSVKNEVVLGFEADDSTEGITEMRLTVPDDNFVDNLRERSDTGKTEAVFTFEEMTNISPRGKSDFLFDPNSLRIMGKTFQHKIPYSSIKRVIEIVGEKNVNIVSEVDPSIKQGLTGYDFINTRFEKDIEEDFQPNINQDSKEAFPSIQTYYSGELYKTFIKAMELFTKRPVEQLSNFQSAHGLNYVSCNYKAAEARFHFTWDGILLLPKVYFIPFKKIKSVEFSRVNVSVMTSKMFDMKINTLDCQYQFSALEKDEFGPVETHLGKHGVATSIDVIEHHISEDEDDSTTDINNPSTVSENTSSSDNSNE